MASIWIDGHELHVEVNGTEYVYSGGYGRIVTDEEPDLPSDLDDSGTTRFDGLTLEWEEIDPTAGDSTESEWVLIDQGANVNAAHGDTRRVKVEDGVIHYIGEDGGVYRTPRPEAVETDASLRNLIADSDTLVLVNDDITLENRFEVDYGPEEDPFVDDFTDFTDFDDFTNFSDFDDFTNFSDFTDHDDFDDFTDFSDFSNFYNFDDFNNFTNFYDFDNFSNFYDFSNFDQFENFYDFFNFTNFSDFTNHYDFNNFSDHFNFDDSYYGIYVPGPIFDQFSNSYFGGYYYFYASEEAGEDEEFIGDDPDIDYDGESTSEDGPEEHDDTPHVDSVNEITPDEDDQMKFAEPHSNHQDQAHVDVPHLDEPHTN